MSRRTWKATCAALGIVGLATAASVGLAQAGGSSKPKPKPTSPWLSPVSLAATVSPTPGDNLYPPDPAHGPRMDIASLAAIVQKHPFFGSLIPDAAGGVTTEWAAYDNDQVGPKKVDSYVVVLKDVPLKSFAHGGSTVNAPLTDDGTLYDYYIVINAQTGQPEFSFDGVEK